MNRLARRAVLAAAVTAVPHLLAAQERTTVGGYGEIHYTNASGTNTPGSVNLKRFVIFLAHSFDSRITFRSELEVEDAKVESGAAAGEVSLEQAYLDFRFSDALTLRSGLVLVPVGIINETHEPPTFNGVDRPSFEHDVIPSTWREIGVGATGTLPFAGGFSYRAFVVNGLKAEGFDAAEGIRGGRQEGQNASFANPSLTGRLEYARPGLKVGGSFWVGGSTAADPALGSGSFENRVTLVSADARWDGGPFSARAVVANIGIGGAAAINTTFGAGIGSRIAGGYVEGAYDLLAALAPASREHLFAFVRHERYDTHAAVPAGTTRDPMLARRNTTLGLTYKPLPSVAFKGDVTLLRNRAGIGEANVLSLGIGYWF